MNADRLTSKSLLHRLVSENHHAAWDHFVRLYTPLLFFWAQNTMGLRREEAEDLIQDLLIHLMNKMPEFEYNEAQSFRGWLRAILLNRCRDYYREKRRLPGNLDSGLLRNEHVSDNVQMFTDQEYHSYLARRALEIMKNDFEETSWKTCWMRVVEGKSAKEVALSLGVTENTVHLAKSRIIRRLRENLDGLLDL
ncbi:MAG: sigma-70 family RNA polymerase sigma factor [Planctomycetaceae bacterium]|nr:sigma-70 family RNA polymerase sigma factor [Planctomycetaceae bacterium]